MQTEHLKNVRPAMVFTAWFIAVAFTSLILFILIRAGLLDPNDSGGSRWVVIAVVVGFVAGGFFTGWRVGMAPTLYGIAIGLTSLVVWVVINGLSTLFFPDFSWQGLTPNLTISMLLVQMVGAVLGARFGYRFAVAN